MPARTLQEWERLVTREVIVDADVGLSVGRLCELVQQIWEDAGRGRDQLLAAVQVFTLDPRHVEWLTTHDPMALRQAQHAIAVAEGKAVPAGKESL